MANEARRGTDVTNGSARKAADDVEKLANDVVELLGVEDAITREIERKGDDSLFARIEECDKFAIDAPVNSDMMFLALSLPIANGLIYFATSRERLRIAREWIQTNWHDKDDPISTLAALTLIYIVKRGWREYHSRADKQDVWVRINRRVEKLKHDTETAVSGGPEPAPAPPSPQN